MFLFILVTSYYPLGRWLVNMESRAVRYSKKNRIKRKLKRLFIKLIKTIIRNIIYLLVGLVYFIYSIIRAFDNLIAKLFNKLPRLLKVAIIYMLILNVGLDIYTIFKKDNLDSVKVTINDKVIDTETLTTNPTSQNEANLEETQQECLFDSTSCLIAQKGQEIGLNEEQILISISISKWETGNYTSEAFKNLNNVGGMMCSTGLIYYDTLNDGISAFISNLKYNYFDIGLDTLEKIQPKYCPIGASNDPNNLNQYWLNGTTKMYNELVSK